MCFRIVQDSDYNVNLDTEGSDLDCKERLDPNEG